MSRGNVYEKDFEFEGGYLRASVDPAVDVNDYSPRDQVKQLSFSDGERRVYFTVSAKGMRSIGEWLIKVAEFEEGA